MKMFLSRYGIHDVRSLMREHEEFEVETDGAGEPSFSQPLLLTVDMFDAQ